jgi:hypothetical protein
VEELLMASLAKIRANQRNARKSTGPRTRAGKAIVARNARTHGLNLPAWHDQSLAREVVDLARAIETSVIGAAADATGHALACRIAEAMIDWRRVRLAKLALVATLAADPGDRRALRQLWRLDRYEARAFVRRTRAIRAFDAVVLGMRSAKQSQRRKPNDSRRSLQAATAERLAARTWAAVRRYAGRNLAKQTQRRNANDSSRVMRRPMSPLCRNGTIRAAHRWRRLPTKHDQRGRK